MAIEEALRRFDGEEGRRPIRLPASFGVPFRLILARPQVAALATIVLVTFIGLPLWLSDIGPRVQRDAAISEPAASRSVALDVEEVASPPPAAFAPPTRGQQGMPRGDDGPAEAEAEAGAVAPANTETV